MGEDKICEVDNGQLKCTELEKLSEHEKTVLLEMTMISLRGSWMDPKERLQIVQYLSDHISSIPPDLAKSIGWKVPACVSQRSECVSGDSPLAYFDGRTFRGSYEELGKITVKLPHKKQIMKKVYNKILCHTSDMDFGDEFYDEHLQR